MKRQILLSLIMLVTTSFVFAEGISEGTGQTKSEACSNAKEKIPSTEKASSGCYCNEPVYQDGLWSCRLNYQYRGYSDDRRSYSNDRRSYSNPSYTPSYGGSSGRFTPIPAPQRNPYILQGQR